MTMHMIPESCGSTDAAGYITRIPSPVPHDAKDRGGCWALYDSRKQRLGYFSACDAAIVHLFSSDEPPCLVPGYMPPTCG